MTERQRADRIDNGRDGTMATTRERKRYHVMTGTGTFRANRKRNRCIASRSGKASAERIAALYGPLVWIELR